ncbi:MAG: IPT/TIG domain-containing protein [Treponemataceae bacterium]|nr:IPT/TIG domain-containing protein [Treponemataceae bacterium]
MSIGRTLSVLYRSYPLFRISCIVFLCLLCLGIVSFITFEAKKLPAIRSLSPAVGSAGDVMTIQGEHFGEERSTSGYVEIGGSRLTAQGYLSWTDTQIRIVLPTNVQDGLVIVATKNGRSKPGFFANEAGIPVAVPPDTQTSLPVITAITPQTGSYGTLMTIRGTNFGTVRGNGAVFFSANRDDASQATFTSGVETDSPGEFNPQFIPASETNYDYEYWSDGEIRVRIPDGAADGSLFVRTEKGASNALKAEIRLPAGTKSYTGRRTYVLQMTEDLEDLDSKNTTSVTLRVPRPLVTAAQPMADLTECKPEPVIANYKNTIIHQVELVRASNRKIKFSQQFVVAVYTVQTDVNAKKVRPFNEKSRVLYRATTQPDSLIQSNDEAVAAKAKEIVGKETNPYLQAKLVYDYMLDAYDFPSRLSRENESALDLLRKERGDAYDFAVLYTTLVRALGIPCLPVSGILVDADLHVQPHWWSEFYIEQFGWIPVDVALAKGLDYKAFKPLDDARAFYFGNLDSQHIAFSRGWNEVKPALVNSKIVRRAKSYAFQSIWEESSEGKVNYSTLWNDPVVLGVY